MSEPAGLSEEQLYRLAQAAALTQQQLAYARQIVAGAGISNAEITAAILHALAINYAASVSVPPPKSKSSARRAPSKAAVSAADVGYQSDLLAPQPLPEDPFGI